MEFLSCVPKQSKSNRSSHWGTWGRGGSEFLDGTGSVSKKSLTMPSRLNNDLRRSASSPVKLFGNITEPLQKHILPRRTTHKFSGSDKAYKTLFSIPESESTLFRECPMIAEKSMTLKRSRTLPASGRNRGIFFPSSISYSGSKEQYKSKDDLSIDHSSVRSLKDKFCFDTICRQLRSRSLRKKESAFFSSMENRKNFMEKSGLSVVDCPSYAQRSMSMPSRKYYKNIHGSKDSLEISLPRSASSTTNSSFHLYAKLNEIEMVNDDSLREPVIQKVNPDHITDQNICSSKQSTDASNPYFEDNASTKNFYTIPFDTKYEAPSVTSYQTVESDSDSSVTLNDEDERLSIKSDDTVTEKDIHPSSFNQIINEEDLRSVNLYSGTNSISSEATSVSTVPQEIIDQGKRHSLSSSTSYGSRLTYGTSTDEGFCSNMSETSSSNLWSSGDHNLYSSMSSSSSCLSSFSIESSVSKGAIPKRKRGLCFKRCKGTFQNQDSNKVSFSETFHCSEVAVEGDFCVRCKKHSEEIFTLKRSGSLKVPKQLPVTPTLLRILQLGLEQVDSSTTESDVTNGVGGVVRREKLHPPRTDAHRLSRANLEESGDLELDAILNELCALESQFNFEISSNKSSSLAPSNNTTCANLINKKNIQNTNLHKMQVAPTNNSHLQQSIIPRTKTHSRSGSGGMKPKFDPLNMDVEISPSTIVSRTDSPDNDSAFSDNVSMLSSESSASSGASGGGGLASKHDRAPSAADHAAKMKAEKIKMALEKLKEANVKKLFIKAFSHDGSSKSLLVDEKMTVAYVCRMLTDKNHVRVDPKWAIIEHIPDLYMERIYEDDEMLVENLLQWTRDSKNKLLFLERPDKYDLFLRPKNYLLYGTSQKKSSEIDDEARNNLLEEFFSTSSVPEVEGPLFLKSDGKKAWKKFYFVLRQSGLYYCPKGKSSRSSKDLVCLATFDANQVYRGFGWKKKFKAPTDWGLAIKLPQLQAKSSKHIKYLCAEDQSSLAQWVMGIRIAKNGQRLLDNYRCLVEDINQEDIDMLASSRSFSLTSVSVGGSRGPSEATTPSSESQSLDSCLAPSLTPSMVEGIDEIEDNCSSSSQDTPVNTLSRAPGGWSIRSASSSSSSGCLSERSSTGTPTGEHGFEAEYPQQGTIKRKPPSTNPKIPLTSTTRHLVKEADLDDRPSSRNSTLRLSTRKSIQEEVNTLRRRNSARSSVASSVVSSSIASTEATVEEEELPLPPPPLELGISCDPEYLPPPPPELMASTLSLNSLPPPPEECLLPTFNDDAMMTSMISLPPPSPPKALSPPATPPKPKSLISPIYQPPLSPPAVAPKPSPDAVYATRGILTEPRPSNGWSAAPLYATPKSPQKKVKKITFLDDVQNIPPSPSPPQPSSPAKPPLPKRSFSTRLSPHIPGKLDTPGCKVTPPKAFLSNLQRVMQKKWQVAQKCRDFEKTPHEVLGFRDPVPPKETEKNVGAWIQEHYGSLYENLAPTSPDSNGFPPPMDESATSPTQLLRSQTVPARKKPPPLPPKRSETTHLSGRQ